MNGPQHFRAAEELLALASAPRRFVTGLDAAGTTEEQLARLGEIDPTLVFASPNVEIIDNTLAAAQVHATLALAAATIDASPQVDDVGSWEDVMIPWQGPDA